MNTQIEKLYTVFTKNPKVTTDTRSIEKGSLFFALKGANFNGNEFAAKAIESGAALAVIDEEKYAVNENFLLVDDVLKAFQDLANFHRKKLALPIIAITGTNGKTTTKELVNQVLSQKYKTSATIGNLNNHIGVPLTLLKMDQSHEMGIVEMGANHVGEIEMLCKIAEPNFGIITNIGKAHLEGFGGYEGVIKAKSELYHYIKNHNGTAFINQDNELLAKLSKELNTITYGTSERLNCTGKVLDQNPFVKFEYKTSTASEAIQSQLIGRYNFENLLAACCIGDHFKVSSESIKKAIESYVPSNNRSQVVKKDSNTIFLDAYNANPTSMEAAINNFAELKAENKLLILGDMLELGEDSEKEHQRIVDLLKEKGLNHVMLVGPHFGKAKNSIGAETFSNASELIEFMKTKRATNSNILIKGSRGIKLETVLEVL